MSRAKSIQKPARRASAATQRRPVSFVAMLGRVADDCGDDRLPALLGVTERSVQRWQAGADPGPMALSFIAVLDQIRPAVHLEALARGELVLTLEPSQPSPAVGEKAGPQADAGCDRPAERVPGLGTTIVDEPTMPGSSPVNALIRDGLLIGVSEYPVQTFAPDGLPRRKGLHLE